MALLLHSDPRGRQGFFTEECSGGGLGFAGSQNSIAIAFAQYESGYGNILVYYNGAGPNVADLSRQYARNVNLPRFDDGAMHTIQVTYRGAAKLLTVRYDGSQALQTSVSLSDHVAVNGLAYVGFTASTGDATVEQVIHSFSLCTNASAFLPPTSADSRLAIALGVSIPLAALIFIAAGIFIYLILRKKQGKIIYGAIEMPPRTTPVPAPSWEG